MTKQCWEMKDCTTEEFWEAMCDVTFFRIDLHTGLLRGEMLHTDEPPEEVPTFITSKVELLTEFCKRK